MTSKIWGAAPHFFRRLFRQIEAKKRLAKSNSIRLFGKTGHRGTSVSIEPFGYRDLFFEYVPEGRYNFSVAHEDRMLHKNRKVLIATFTTSDFESQSQISAETQLARSDKGNAFAYLGKGRWSNNQCKQTTKITFDKERAWVGVRVQSSIDRYVNLENIRLAPDVIGLEDTSPRIKPYMARMLDKRPDLLEAEFILYADINLNIVDGSSVWLSSMISALSSTGKTLVWSKKDIETDIIWSNVKDHQNVLLLSPQDFDASGQTAVPEASIELIRELDMVLPNVRRVVVRGLHAAEMLSSDRQFRGRSVVYLTDFYEIEDGELKVSEQAANSVETIAAQAGYLLAQTSELGEKIAEIAGRDISWHHFPPPIPNDLPKIRNEPQPDCPVKIGYAGKITPQWGVSEMLDWTQELQSRGLSFELHIVANRISDGVGKKNEIGFGQSIRSKIEGSGASHYNNFNRQASMEKMGQMDFVWCYRPPILEENTLEVSTKLIEMVGAGAACLCYPSKINRKLLGEGYPYFIRSKEDLARLLKADPKPLPDKLSDGIKADHGLKNVTQRLASNVLGKGQDKEAGPKIVFAGHDYKFADPYISNLKANGHNVCKDQWDWGGPIDIAETQRLHSEADIVFCEWGLANAVWHSENKREGTKLFVRIHLQEINERARRFGYEINKESVDGYIFVEESVRQTAIEMFDIPKSKTHLIPNFLLDDEYQNLAHQKHSNDVIRLGMIGITPQRKRFDLAVQLLETLINSGQKASLDIKGPRPETLEFMHAPGRAEELAYYNDVYAQIEQNPQLSQAVTFSPWGNDVAAWYRKVDFVLSPSDFESFHYALADGILSGCSPLIWPWQGAEEIYHPDWLIEDVADAFKKVGVVRSKTKSDRIADAQNKRTIMVSRYGHKTIFERLSQIIGIDPP